MFKWLTNLFRKEKSKGSKLPKTITVKQFVDENWQAQIKNKTVSVFEKRSWKDVPSWDDMVVYARELCCGYHRFRYVNTFGEVELRDEDQLVVMRRNPKKTKQKTELTNNDNEV